MSKIVTPAMVKYQKKNRKPRKYSPAKESWKRFCRNRTAVLGLVILGLLLLMAIFADIIAPYGFQEQNMREMYQTPSAAHWFGTDNFGRDLFSRCVYGARYSLSLSMICVITSTLTGGALGLVSGYCGGKVDNIIMRLMDVLQSIPMVLMALTISSALGNGMWQLVTAITVSCFPSMARNFRNAILNVKTADYIESSRAIGVKQVNMVLRHMLPNAVGVIIIYVVSTMSATVTLVASLSYLGVGLTPPAAEWGLILSDGKAFFATYPHMVIFPAIMIMITVMALNMVGDGLRDAFDPRLK